MPTSKTGVRQGRAERTRSLIIDTAARAFAEGGFDGVSLNDLILASGMSKGAFYFHFSSKEEVALAAFRAKQQELIARLLADAEPGASASDELRGALRRRARLISDDPTMHCVARLGADLSVRSGPGSEYASFQELGVRSIAELIERGSLGRVRDASRCPHHGSGDLRLDRRDGLTVAPGFRWQGPRGANRGGPGPADSGARSPTSHRAGPPGPPRCKSKQDREDQEHESEEL